MATQVAKAKETAPAVMSELDEQMRKDAGHGVSTDARDNIIPQINVLQPLSPEVLDGPAQVDGAKPGDFLLANKTLIPGKEGIWFQPAKVVQIWLEFTPLAQGGGFVGAHEFVDENQPPPGARRKERFRMVFDNGNECIHYRQMAGIAWIERTGMEYNISFKSTGHTIVKEWMTKAIRSNRFNDGSSRPFYGHIYKLTTSQRRNNAGQWYVIDVGDPVLLSSAAAADIVDNPTKAYRMGQLLAKAFENKEKVAEVASRPNESKEVGDEIPF